MPLERGGSGKLAFGLLLIGASALSGSGTVAAVLGGVAASTVSGVGVNWVSEAVGSVVGAGPPPDEALREAFRRAVQAAVKELRQAYTDERIRRDGADAFKLLREVARDAGVTEVPQGATEIVAVQRGLAGALGQLLHGFPEPQVQLVRERLLPATARAFQAELANDPKAWRLYHSWVLERLIQQSAALQVALAAQPAARAELADAGALEDRLDEVEERLTRLLAELREELKRAASEPDGNAQEQATVMMHMDVGAEGQIDGAKMRAEDVDGPTDMRMRGGDKSTIKNSEMVATGVRRRATPLPSSPVILAKIHQERRIDAIVPRTAVVGEPIRLLAQVRFPDSPALGLSDWPSNSVPGSVEQGKGMLGLTYKTDPQTGQPLDNKIKLKVITTSFDIDRAERVVPVPYDQTSPIISFQLIPRTSGRALIDIEACTLDDDVLGQASIDTNINPPDKATHDSETRPGYTRIQIVLQVTPREVSLAVGKKETSIGLALRFIPTATGATITWEGDVVGNHTSTFVSPFQGADLDIVLRALDHLQHPSSPLDAADIARIAALGLPTDSGMLAHKLHQAVGGQLFSALTSDSAAARALASARDAAARARLPLSLSLHLPQGAVALAALPWELLWAEDEPTPLLLSRGPAGRLIRHLDLAHAFPAPRQGGRPLRVLAVVPHAGIEPADRDAERVARTASWAALAAGGDVELLPDLSPAAPTTLADALRGQGGKLDVLHFIGHGKYLNGEGYLVLDSPDGNWAPTPVSQVAPAIAAAGVRLAVLSSCQGAVVGTEPVAAGLLGGVAPALVAHGVPLVVAMQLTIRADAAQAATRVIYEQLAAGQSVPAAVAAARLHLWISEHDRASWYVPTLYVRARQASDEGLL